MKYKERDEIVRDLRALADFIEKDGISLPFPTITASTNVMTPAYTGVRSKKWGAYCRNTMMRAAIVLKANLIDVESSYPKVRTMFGSITYEVWTPRDYFTRGM